MIWVPLNAVLFTVASTVALVAVVALVLGPMRITR